ncbi:MAG: cytochrome c oxidase subunit 3 [Planctomycetaceae bacterium]
MSNVPSPSTDDYWLHGLPTRRLTRSEVALRFLLLSVGVTLVASMVAWVLMRWIGRDTPADFQFPLAFAATTALLLFASLTIDRALRAVRRERQSLFRRWLRRSIVVGCLFMGVQSYALWTIVPQERSPGSASLGVAPFVLMLAALHGLHFLVATLFVSYITVQAHADRYDHEYHWGVTVCAWFWHALGVVWIAILAVYTIVLM